MHYLRIAIFILALLIIATPAWAERIEGNPIVIGSGNLYIGDSDSTGTIRWYDANGEFFSITAADLAADITFTWPVTDGDADQFMQTDGAGVLTWASVVAPEAGTAAGQMLYWDHGNTTWKHTEITELFWDDTDKWLGVGTSSATAPLHAHDATAEDLLVLEYTGGDASGSTIEFYHNSASPADNDRVGELIFQGEDSASAIEDFVVITAYAEDVTDATEDGGLAIEVQIDGTLSNIWDCWEDLVVINDDGKDVDFRVESDLDADLICTDAATEYGRVGFCEPNPDALVEINADLTSTGEALHVHRDRAGGADTDSPVVHIHQDNVDDDQQALSITQDATGSVRAIQCLSTATGHDEACIFGQTSSTTSPGCGVAGRASGATGAVYGVLGSTLSTDNASYSLYALNRTKVGIWADFDENNAASTPTVANAPTGDGRLYCANDDTWSWVNDAGKAYGWTDADGDTGIDVELTADVDAIHMKTGGTERLQLDSTKADFAVPVEASTNFIIDTTPGIDAASIVIITDVDIAGVLVKYRTATFEGGILTAMSAESGWTSAPLNP